MCRCELYQRGQHHQAKAQGQRQPDNGLFPVPRESEQFLRKRDKVLNLLKTLTKTQRAQGLVEGARVQAVSPGSSQVRLHVMNTVNGGGQRIKLCRSGMISYPNFRAGSPDVVLLAQLAEEAGVDLRIIVLTRPAGVCVFPLARSRARASSLFLASPQDLSRLFLHLLSVSFTLARFLARSLLSESYRCMRPECIRHACANALILSLHLHSVSLCLSLSLALSPCLLLSSSLALVLVRAL